MRVNVTSRFSPHPLYHHPYKPNVPPSPVASVARRRGIRLSESAVFGAAVKLSLPFHHFLPPLRRTISASFYGGDNSSKPNQGGDEFAFQIEEFTRQASAEKLAFFDEAPPTSTMAPFCPSKLDLLEPSLLGIRPEPPDWPAREEVIRHSIARKANCVELPLSLRMIKKKKKQQRLQEGGGIGGGGGEGGFGVGGNGISKAFSSTVSVIGDLQSHALRLRGLALDEDFESIVGKVRTEMNSSFVWLFQEVFSRTPELMVNVMVLTVDFACSSIQKNSAQAVAFVEAALMMVSEKRGFASSLTVDGSKEEEEKEGGVADNVEELLVGLAQMMRYPSVVVPSESSTSPLIELGEEEQMGEEEAKLWNSMVEDSSRIRMQGEKVVAEEEEDRIGGVMGLDHRTTQQFVSPVWVEIEKDDYVEYHRTDLLYQIGVSQEPNNPLLLSNYAQFLYLVARDYDRAEECFQRAIQVDSTDPEVLSQYATFLWVIRKDIWGAEERYQQAVAAEPGNSYYASKYASFLWSTGGQDTCYHDDDDATPAKN